MLLLNPKATLVLYCLANDFGPELISTSKAKVPKDSGALNDGEVLKAAITSFHFGMDPNQRVVDLKDFGFEKCWFRKVVDLKGVGFEKV
jgi:hypothetical protein